MQSGKVDDDPPQLHPALQSWLQSQKDSNFMRDRSGRDKLCWFRLPTWFFFPLFFSFLCSSLNMWAPGRDVSFCSVAAVKDLPPGQLFLTPGYIDIVGPQVQVCWFRHYDVTTKK